MKMKLGQALQQAVAAHKEGKLQEAERLYRAILQTQPEHPDANHNLGVLAVAVGKPRDAVPMFKLALETNPKQEQFWLSFINALIKLERLDEVRRVLVKAKEAGVSQEKLDALGQRLNERAPNIATRAKKALRLSGKRKKLAEKKKRKKTKARGSSQNAAPSREQINSLLVHHDTGRLAEAEALATLLSEEFPCHPFGWKVLAAVHKRTGRLSESLKSAQIAKKLSPQDEELHNILGNTLQELGRLEEAEASFRQAIALKPHFAEAHSNLGNTLRGLGRLVEAEATVRKAIALKPHFVEAYSNLGVTLRALGRLGEAEASLRQAIALNPDYAKAHSNLGVALSGLGRLGEAEASLRQAIALNPDYAKAHSNLGVALQGGGRLEEAEASLRQAIALKPDYAKAHRYLAVSKKFLSKDKQFVQMEELYHEANLSDDDRCHICFALAKASEDLQDLAAAFQFYAEGNSLRKKRIGYDGIQDKQLFERLKQSFPSINAHSLLSNIVAPKYAPVFIVGMPRSGTTLVEQIISSHPQVMGAGELPFVSQLGRIFAVGDAPVNSEVLKTFREQYLSSLAQYSGGNPIVIDKMPLNFRFLGLIIAAFPEAKIIHVKRDPAAVCWANYTQYFVNDSLGYCYSLDDILHYHELYRDLMEYWHQLLPDWIYDLDYETLTENQEEETRKLISHLGLDWDDACLAPEHNKSFVGTASNVQVRQKVYQGSSEKWKRYLPFLNGALDHLSIVNQ